MTQENGIRLQPGSYMGRGYIECCLPAGLMLDTPAFETIKNDRPPFLCPFSVSGFNGETVLKYDIGNRMSLAYLSGTFSCEDFIRLLKGLLEPLTTGDDWFLDYRYFCFDPQYIYFDRAAMQIFYLYFPIKGIGSTDDDIKALFVDFMDRCQVNGGSQLTANLYKCLMRRDFSLYEFQRIVDQYHAGSAGASGASQIQYQPPMEQKPAAASPAAPSQQTPPPSAPPQSPKGGWNSGGWNSAPASAAPEKGKSKKEKKAPRQENEVFSTLNASDEDDDLEALISGGKKPADQPPAAKGDKKNGSFFGKVFGSGKSKTEPAPAAPAGGFNNGGFNNGSSGGFNSFNNGGAAQNTGANSGRREFIGGAAASRGAGPIPVAVNTPASSGGNTVIGDDDEIESGAFLRYAGSFRNPTTGACPPQLIDIRIHNGAFSIGRFDVTKGYQQSDFEFGPDIDVVSRFQARFEEREDGYYLIHLGSRSKTLVNGQPLAANIPVALKNGDRIGFSTKGVDYIFTVQ